MGLSTNTTTYDGTSNVFPVNFAMGYLDQAHVEVRVNDEHLGGIPAYRDFEWIDDNNIRVPQLTPGDIVTITRTTPKQELDTSFAGSDNITRNNLDRQSKQAMMIYHELVDGRVEGLSSFPSILAEVTAQASVAALAAAALTGITEIINEGSSRSAATLLAASNLPDGTVINLGGLFYEVDSTVTLDRSAGKDKLVAGLKPYGVATFEHYGVLANGTDELDLLNLALSENYIVSAANKTYTYNGTLVLDRGEGQALIGKGGNVGASHSTTIFQPTSTAGAGVWSTLRSNKLIGFQVRSSPARRLSADDTCIDVLHAPVDEPAKGASRPYIHDLFLFGSPNLGLIVAGGCELGTVDLVTVQDAKGHAFAFDDGTTIGRVNKTIAPFMFTLSRCRAMECGGNALLIGAEGDDDQVIGFKTEFFEALGCGWNAEKSVSSNQIVDRGLQSRHVILDVENQQWAETETAQGSSRLAVAQEDRGGAIEFYRDGCAVIQPYFSNMSSWIHVNAGVDGLLIEDPKCVKRSDADFSGSVVVVANGATGVRVNLIDNNVVGSLDYVDVASDSTVLTVDGVPWVVGRSESNTYNPDNDYVDSQISSGQLGFPTGRRLNVTERVRDTPTGSDVLSAIKAKGHMRDLDFILKVGMAGTLTINDGTGTVSTNTNKPIITPGGLGLTLSEGALVYLTYIEEVDAFYVDKVI